MNQKEVQELRDAVKSHSEMIEELQKHNSDEKERHHTHNDDHDVSSADLNKKLNVLQKQFNIIDTAVTNLNES